MLFPETSKPIDWEARFRDDTKRYDLEDADPSEEDKRKAGEMSIGAVMAGKEAISKLEMDVDSHPEKHLTEIGALEKHGRVAAAAGTARIKKHGTVEAGSLDGMWMPYDGPDLEEVDDEEMPAAW